MTTELLFSIAVAVVILTMVLRGHYRHEFTVNDSFAGLLYEYGKLRETLPAGRHVRWGHGFRLVTIDTRKTLLQVPGQEVLTADNVGVKLSVVLTTQIADPALSVQGADNHVMHTYNAAQTAVRAVVAGVTMEALLTQRVSISAQLRELIAPQTEAIGVRVHSVDVRDVMLPGELRKAFSETLKARQEGLAALERARGESAALRNLANVASLVETHPALATLRLLQTLETSGVHPTLVMNDLSSLFMAPSARHAKPSASNPEA